MSQSQRKRKLDEPEIINAGTTVRSIAAATAAAEKSRRQKVAPEGEPAEMVPATFDPAALPPEHLNRYLLRYNLIPERAVTYEQAVFPTPLLTLSAVAEADLIVQAKKRRGQNGRESTRPQRSVASVWQDPSSVVGPHSGLGTLTAFDDASGVLGERLAATARAHWANEASTAPVREGEMIATFMFACRNESFRTSR